MKPQDAMGLFGTLVGVAMVPALGSGGWDAWEIASTSLVSCAGLGTLAWSNKRRIREIISGEGFDEIRPARPDEADAIHSLALESFGEAVTDKGTIASFIRRNPRIFWVLADQSEDATTCTIEGYGCIIPLSHSQQRELEVGQFGLNSLAPTNVPRYKSNVSAVYIGAVVGRRTRVKAKILGFMESQARLEAMKSRTKTVYAKAVTRDGLRTINRRKFDPVFAGHDGINCFYRKIVTA